MAAEPAAMASAARTAVVVMTMVMVGAVEARVVAMGAKEEVEEATVAEAWRVRGLRVQRPHPLLPTIPIVVLRGGMESWRLSTRLRSRV